jgi:hypothetical protein
MPIVACIHCRSQPTITWTSTRGSQNKRLHRCIGCAHPRRTLFDSSGQSQHCQPDLLSELLAFCRPAPSMGRMSWSQRKVGRKGFCCSSTQSCVAAGETTWLHLGMFLQARHCGSSSSSSLMTSWSRCGGLPRTFTLGFVCMHTLITCKGAPVFCRSSWLQQWWTSSLQCQKGKVSSGG